MPMSRGATEKPSRAVAVHHQLPSRDDRSDIRLKYSTASQLPEMLTAYNSILILRVTSRA